MPMADDMTLFLSDSESVRHAVNIFEEFYRYAGLKLNKAKTEVFLINSEHQHLMDEHTCIKYTCSPFKSLGMWFSSDINECTLLNISEKMNTMKNIIKSWQPRCLSLKGKITVIKSLILPHILQLASVITINTKVISELETLLINFVWSNRKHLVSKETLTLPLESGGLKMPSVKYTIETAKVMWIKRLNNAIPAKWKILAETLMGIKVKELFSKQLFISVCHKIKTKFYKNLLSTWFEFQKQKIDSIHDLMNQNLFNSVQLPH